MPRGFWDWGVNPDAITIAPEVSTSELAARLGSIVTYDRRGDVVMLEPFENTLNSRWLAAGLVGGSAAISAVTARNGASSLRIDAGTVLLDGGTVTRLVSFQPTNRMGLEMSFSIPADAVQITATLRHYDGANYHQGSVSYRSVDSTLRYMDSAGVLQVISVTPPLVFQLNAFNTLKFVADFIDEEYGYAMLGGLRYDLSGIALYTAVDTTAPHVMVQIEVVNASGTGNLVYFDDVILTQNEP